MTPRSVISVLLESLRLKDMAYMKDVFPAGGQTGTIQNGFKGKNGKPYIYAKSGSLKNVYCLSGFLLTKSGNILLFSWMNNQFEGRSTEVKASMEKFFSFLYEQY
jgi:D-alanyl-D-alanine carboxypeptidase/D-alanyl-D-alanine-endopeptidase (penicillin-binding protein 4)